jgi:hypothetical protein
METTCRYRRLLPPFSIEPTYELRRVRFALRRPTPTGWRPWLRDGRRLTSGMTLEGWSGG